MSNEELVSVIVLSYNSEKTIINTLDSIKKQNYLSIELIVADDHSTDKTRNIAEKWINNNKIRFVKSTITDEHENFGTSKNLNYAISHSTGEWIKIIAADDLLLPDCITKCVQAKNSQRESKIFQGGQIIINAAGENIGESNVESYRMKKVNGLSSVIKQYHFFLYDDVKLSPSLFFEKKAFNSVGGCDECIRNIEDYPLKLRFLSNGFRMGYINTPIVKYRVHDSISHDTNKCYQVHHFKNKRIIKKKYCYPYIRFWNIGYWMAELNDIITFTFVVSVLKNKKNKVSRSFLRFMSLFNPRDIREKKNSILAMISKSGIAKR